MKLKRNADTIALLKSVQSCKGEVLFLTDEGDRLNLKSTLSSYVFCIVTGSPDIMASGRLFCSEPEDFERLSAFLEN